MITAPPGFVLISCDLSQAESWVVAYEADEPEIKAALVSQVGFHVTTARLIFDNDNIVKSNEWEMQVFTGKKTNHATSYKMGPYVFAESYNAEAKVSISNSQAKHYQDKWHTKYTRIKPWWEDIAYELKTADGYLTTAYGRRRQFLGPQHEQLQKEAIAFRPQGTVADHFRGRLQRHNEIPGGLLHFRRCIADRYPTEISIIQQGHDSALVLAKREIAFDVANEFKACLYRPIIIKGEVCQIPVDGEIGERWGEMEKIKWAA
jgi:hypothetical protein